MNKTILVSVVSIVLVLIVKVALVICVWNWFKTRKTQKIETVVPQIIVEGKSYDDPSVKPLSKPRITPIYDIPLLIPRPVRLTSFDLRKTRSSESFVKLKMADRPISESKSESLGINPDYDKLSVFASSVEKSFGTEEILTSKEVLVGPDYLNLSNFKYLKEQKAVEKA